MNDSFLFDIHLQISAAHPLQHRTLLDQFVVHVHGDDLDSL